MQSTTRVALDAMGGDNAPAEVVKGAVDAVNKRNDIKIFLVGQKVPVERELSLYTYPKEQIEIVGFISCGGCPGKKTVLRAKELVKRGADTIAFASCIKKGTPIGFPCPFAKKMMEAVSNAVGEDVEILDYTH